MFSAVVSVDSRLNDWNVKPIWSVPPQPRQLPVLETGDLGVPDPDPPCRNGVEPG